MAFREVGSQWRAVPLGRGKLFYLGLDYAGAKAGLDLAGIKVTPDIWRGIRVMEAETCAVLNQAPRKG